MVAAKLNANFVANVHDEWQIECSEEDADLVGEAAVQSIIEAGTKLALRCPLDGEYKKGKTYKSDSKTLQSFGKDYFEACDYIGFFDIEVN